MGCRASGFPVHHHLLKPAQTHIHWVGDAIQPSHPLFFPFPLPSIFPSIRVFSRESALCIRWSKYQSFSFSISLPMNIQGWFPLEWLAWPSCSPWDSQESSPAPQFKSIKSLVLSLLYGPILTSVHDHWENHSFDCMDICWESDVSPFNTLPRFVIDKYKIILIFSFLVFTI